jgi:hypothetical protein
LKEEDEEYDDEDIEVESPELRDSPSEEFKKQLSSRKFNLF